MILTAMRLILNSLSTLKAGLPGLVSASRLAVAHSQLLNTEWHQFQMCSLIECTSLQPCDETSTVTVIDESSTVTVMLVMLISTRAAGLLALMVWILIVMTSSCRLNQSLLTHC